MGTDSSAIAATLEVARAIIRGETSSDAVAEPGLAVIRKQSLAPLAYASGVRAFRAAYAAVVLDAQGRRAIVLEAVSALAAANVDVALLKGVSYIGDIYPDDGHRPMGDVDLLVRPEQFERAFEALSAIGFRDRTTGGGTAVHHAWQLFRGKRSIDLHRSIIQPWRAGIRLADVWARSIPATDLTPARRLDPVDQLLFHCAHMGRSEFAVPLINFVDCQRLASRLSGAEMTELFARSRSYRLSRSVRSSLAVTSALAEGRDRAAIGGWGLVLPGCSELARGGLPPRPLQLLRKAVLNDSARDAVAVGLLYGARWSLRSLRRLTER